MPKIDALVITCEHGGNSIPPRWRALFRGRRELLDSHRGWDPGALTLARRLARATRAPLVYSTVSRLLVELNRSPGHRDLFSELTRPLSPLDRSLIVERHYKPYRAAVESEIESAIRALPRGRALLHLSVHTFTPERDGQVRNADVGLLYDPKRAGERAFAAQWRDALRIAAPELRVRMNYPYRGADDGLTTHLRRQFLGTRYLGLELEVNQALAAGTVAQRRRVARAAVSSLLDAMQKL